MNTDAPDAKTNAWLATFKPNSRANLRLFCFPYSGAGASIYYPWLSGLQGDIEVCPVQLPGREARLSEPPFTQLPPLVEAVAQALLPYLDIPFAFFGHSMGALVSFELARYLRKQCDLRPAQLFVSGYGAPQIPDRQPPISALPEPEFLERLRRFNGTQDEVLRHPELRQLFLPILRADFAICETYVYEADLPLDCPISAFCGLEDDHVSYGLLEAWREQTSAAFSLRMFPGNHFFLNTARPLLLMVLARELHQLASALSLRSGP